MLLYKYYFCLGPLPVPDPASRRLPEYRVHKTHPERTTMSITAVPSCAVRHAPHRPGPDRVLLSSLTPRTVAEFGVFCVDSKKEGSSGGGEEHVTSRKSSVSYLRRTGVRTYEGHCRFGTSSPWVSLTLGLSTQKLSLGI